MPDLIKFSDLAGDHPLQLDGANDLLAIAIKNEASNTGYSSLTTTPNQLGAYAVEDMTFVNLTTTAKTVEGAINELNTSGAGWTDLTDTLLAGETTLTISDEVITTSSTIDYYTDVFGVNPTNIVVATGSVTLTFEEQASDLGVKVRVS